MRTALRRPQRGRLLHADEHLALFLYVIDLLNSPAIAQRQYLVKHFFGNHGSARIKANSLTHYKRRGTKKVSPRVRTGRSSAINRQMSDLPFSLNRRLGSAPPLMLSRNFLETLSGSRLLAL